MYKVKRRGIFGVNKLSCLLIALICILCGCSASEKISYEYEAFEYVDHTTYAIKDYRGVIDDVLEIPSEHDGCPVTDILDGVFQHRHMKELRMETVIHIYEEAFQNCLDLTSIDFGVVETIGHCAFRNCTDLESVTIPKTVTTIESEAFMDCSNLEAVYFEGSPDTIGNHAFEPGVTLYGPADSSVEEYAKNNGLEFVSWEPDADQ